MTNGTKASEFYEEFWFDTKKHTHTHTHSQQQVLASENKPWNSNYSF